MLIILEGPDCSGKTTLAYQLADYVNERYGGVVEYVHAGPPTRHPLAEYEEPLFDYRPGTGKHLIIDRWHLGEAVYPQVLDRLTQWDGAIARHLDMFMQARGAVIVGLLPRVEKLLECIDDRGDQVIKSQHVGHLHTLFSSVLARQQTVTFRFSQPVNMHNVEHIVRIARLEEAATTKLNQFVTYIGPARPHYLMLGDVRGTEKTRPTIPRLAPAFMPFRATSGHYIFRHFGERSLVGVANACDVDDVKMMWDALGRPHTVALGANASRACENAGIIAGSGFHPQYVRRFHHGRGETYVSQLFIAARHPEHVVTI